MNQQYNVVVAFIVIALVAVILDRFESPTLRFKSKVARTFLWAILIMLLLSRWPVISKMIGGV